MATRPIKNRETWLNEFTRRARPMFKELGHPIPDNVRMAVGYTSAGHRGKRIGECWSSECSADKSFEIFIKPSLADARRVAGVLTHELIHAAVGIKEGHGKVFGKMARGLGLEGKLTATTEGPDFDKWAGPIIEKLGPIPHAALTGGQGTGPKKQTTRLLKCECDDCGFTFRASKQWALSCDMRCPDPDCGGAVNVSG